MSKDAQARVPIVQVRGLCTHIGQAFVHDGLDLAVRRGEILGLVGASGTGKSMLLRSIIGLQRPCAGSIEVFGEDIATATAAQRIELGRRWGVLFQDGALFSGLSVAQNVKVSLREHANLSEQLMDEIVAMKLALSGLPSGAGNKIPSELSPGMRKRAALARALALDPDILLLDEPTAGLDAPAAAAFDALLVELRDVLGFTVLMVTHDLDSLVRVCERVAVLADKRVAHIGTYESLLASEHPWIRQMFHGSRARAAQEGLHNGN